MIWTAEANIQIDIYYWMFGKIWNVFGAMLSSEKLNTEMLFEGREEVCRIYWFRLWMNIVCIWLRFICVDAYTLSMNIVGNFGEFDFDWCVCVRLLCGMIFSYGPNLALWFDSFRFVYLCNESLIFSTIIRSNCKALWDRQ